MDAFRLVLLTLASLVDRRNDHTIAYLRAENEILREHLGLRRIRSSNTDRRKRARAAKPLGRGLLRDPCPVVTPDTLLRWYRNLVARKYDGSAKRAPTRRRTTRDELRDLVTQMALENDSWGYTRILGALKILGHDVGRTIVRRILDEAGISPAPKCCQASQMRALRSRPVMAMPRDKRRR